MQTVLIAGMGYPGLFLARSLVKDPAIFIVLGVIRMRSVCIPNMVESM